MHEENNFTGTQAYKPLKHLQDSLTGFHTLKVIQALNAKILQAFSEGYMSLRQ